ncbi:MAG: anhydro-N-acetylmuramic acid kinase [Litoreibacter sp.]|nr:anhydro-N-acetylmuramic acid kinase [Litoreibacter sp.]
MRRLAEGKALKSGDPIWALGAMSGTSLDGVDAALLRTDGIDILDFGETGYRAYAPQEQAVLRRALGRWPGEAGVEEAAEVVETAHAALLTAMLAKEEVGLVGFHGQTFAHDPAGGRTHQAGDGALLADILGRPVVWGFRTADMQMGGQGAPLAPFFHFACARWIGASEPLVFLNLGGVANLTYVDPAVNSAEDEGAVLAFDTGPANAPINDLVQARRGESSDEDGRLALAGQADADIVTNFLEAPYFLKIPPKSLDRDDFGLLGTRVANLSDADACATLAACASAAVARGMEHLPRMPERVLVTGGGRRNPALMAALQLDLPANVIAVEEVGLDGDMLEAQAFAYLAVRVARGLPTSGPSTTGVGALIGGGILSRPRQ